MKDDRTKSRKIDLLPPPPLSPKIPKRLNPPFRADPPKNLKIFSHFSLVQKMFALDKPSSPLTADVFYGTIPNWLLQHHNPKPNTKVKFGALNLKNLHIFRMDWLVGRSEVKQAKNHKTLANTDLL